MILQTYSWRADIGERDPAPPMACMRELAARLIPVRPALRGLRLETPEPGILDIHMRVAGISRWAIQSEARKLIVLFIRRAFITPKALSLELVTTARNGRELYLGEGRTQMSKIPRAPQQADGRPWDHYEWWGDELPTARTAPHRPSEPPPPWTPAAACPDG